MAGEVPSRHGSASSGLAKAPPPPSNRADVGQSRLEARDRWNTSEIALRDFFQQWDLDRSGFLEEGELKGLLCRLNGSDEPDDEQYDFVMRNADRDGDGKIDVTEIGYCLRLCASHRRLLRHFAEFDANTAVNSDANSDANSSSIEERVRALLTDINDGRRVPPDEVQHVLRQSSAVSGAVPDRSALLGAVAAWYLYVDRKGMDLPSLIQEAMARTLTTHEGESALAKGHRSIASAVSQLRGGPGDYEPLESGPDEESPADVESGAPESAERRRLSVRRLRLAGAHCASACGAYNYITCPILSNVVLICTGMQLWSSECPHNLGGILAWWGVIGLLFCFLVGFERPRRGRATIGTGVALVVLTFVGGLWTWSDRVQKNKEFCGHLLVSWSEFVWFAIPVGFLGTIVRLIVRQVRKLRKDDVQIQHSHSQRSST